MDANRERVVLVSGAAGTLGAAVVAAFRARRARLVLVERSRGKLERAYGDADPASTLLAGDLDLRDDAFWRDVVTRSEARFGAIDALVHTVGAYRGGDALADDDPQTWRTMLDANLLTAVAACRAVLPGMLARRRGSIVTVASRAALAAEPGAAAYSASKAALLRLTETVAAEGRGAGVRASCLLPGPLDTPQNRATTPREAHGSLVAPAALADVVVFLCSTAARAVSGVALPVGAS